VRRHRRFAVVLALLAVPLGMAPGPGGGASSSCSPGLSTDSTAAQHPGQPVRVTETGRTCPTPEAPAGGSFGGGPPQWIPPRPGNPGDPCTATVLEPTELIVSPGGQLLVFWPNPAFPGTGSDTPEPQDLARVLSGIDPRRFVEEAGTTDFLLPFKLTGKLDATGFNCVPVDPRNPQGSFAWICTGPTVAFSCLVQQPHGIAPGPLDITNLQNGLAGMRAQIAQLIKPGQISSRPAGSNPAVVNTTTCFFIDGASVDGQDPTLTQTFQLVLLGNPDASHRQVYYLFEIRLTPQPVAWTFGDGNGAPGDEQMCRGLDPTPLVFAHRYLSYSPPSGFPITATETYTLHVTEYWYDSGGQPHPALDLGDFQPPIVVQAGPPAGFRKVVVQEEGVPIGG
jgi:hypothetical protein